MIPCFLVFKSLVNSLPLSIPETLDLLLITKHNKSGTVPVPARLEKIVTPASGATVLPSWLENFDKAGRHVGKPSWQWDRKIEIFNPTTTRTKSCQPRELESRSLSKSEMTEALVHNLDGHRT